MPKNIVVGNWKMNTTLMEGVELFKELIKKNRSKKSNNRADLIIVAPPFTHLASFGELNDNADIIYLAAQNCASETSGAYTGEISAAMVKSAGADYVIIGHSERRQYFNESEDELVKKINVALQENLKPIFCCGESLKERESEKHLQIVEKQIKSSLFHLSAQNFLNVIIAYEPVWAIGTGLTASAEQAQEMHSHIRSIVGQRYGAEIADNLAILYGGSCNPGNANTLFGKTDVNGGLIGGASLKPDDFLSIIHSF